MSDRHRLYRLTLVVLSSMLVQSCSIGRDNVFVQAKNILVDSFDFSKNTNTKTERSNEAPVKRSLFRVEKPTRSNKYPDSNYSFVDFFTFEDKKQQVRVNAKMESNGLILISIKHTKNSSYRAITEAEIKNNLILMDEGGRIIPINRIGVVRLKYQETTKIKIKYSDRGGDMVSVYFKNPVFYTDIDFKINLMTQN